MRVVKEISAILLVLILAVSPIGIAVAAKPPTDDKGAKPPKVSFEKFNELKERELETIEGARVVRPASQKGASPVAFERANENAIFHRIPNWFEIKHGKHHQNPTWFYDSSSNHHEITAYGDARRYTSASKFGDGSLILDGYNDWLAIDNHPDWNFGGVDFTIEAWVKFNTLPSSGGQYIIGCWDSLGGEQGWAFSIDEGHGVYTMRFYFSADGTSEKSRLLFSEPLDLNTDSWHHFALTRSGNTYYFFYDGVLVGSIRSATTIYGSSSPLVIGAVNTLGTPAGNVDGYIDELRISDISRWAADFTLLNSPYKNDSDTLLLLHFDSLKR